MKNLVILFFILIFSCQKEKTKENYLGVVNITVTGKQEAIPHFEKGLLLLHSFEYSDSREAFQKASEIDPNMSMAYWGEAMTYNHSLWHEQNFEKAVEVLKKLKALDANQPSTELEKDFVKAVLTLYESDSIKENRDKNYAEYMQKLSEKYPDNHEISAFYALSLLGSVPDGRDDQIYGKGALIVKGILDENPNHPGALHYLIHSYDDPQHAGLALSAADSYAVVAPDASHALHMPSHIYVALGMWDKVVSSNENSYQASLNRMKAKNLSNDARGYHAYHWLEYGYLQQGRTADAKKLVEDMEIYATETPSSRARAHLVFLKGTYLVESDDWNDKVAEIPVEINDLSITVQSQYRFLEGMKAFKKEDKIALDTLIHSMKNDLDKASYLVTYSNDAFCSGATREGISQSMLVETEIMIYQLKALRSWLDTDREQTEDHLKKTITLEEGLSYSYGPPVIQKPTHELYAEWLLQQNRKEEALEQYKMTLEKAPKRKKAMEGLALSQKV
jgi:tetratricopeptide (TPR) repeat protein